MQPMWALNLVRSWGWPQTSGPSTSASQGLWLQTYTTKRDCGGSLIQPEVHHMEASYMLNKSDSDKTEHTQNRLISIKFLLFMDDHNFNNFIVLLSVNQEEPVEEVFSDWCKSSKHKILIYAIWSLWESIFGFILACFPPDLKYCQHSDGHSLLLHNKEHYDYE